MNVNDFIESSVTLRIREKRFLSTPILERMIESDSLEAALKVLNDSIYHQYVVKLNALEDFEEMLIKSKRDFLNNLYRLSPVDYPIDLITLRYHYHNQKVMIKEKILQENLDDLMVKFDRVDMSEIQRKIDETPINDEFTDEKSEEKLDVLTVLKSPEEKDKKEHSNVVIEAIKVYNRTKNPQDIDIVIDREYFAHLQEIAEASNIDLFKRYVEDTIDFTNLKTLLRCKKRGRDINFLRRVLIQGGNIPLEELEVYLTTNLDKESSLFRNMRIFPAVKEGIDIYEQNGSLFTFEQEADNYFIEMAKETKKITYGPEVIFAYALAKENEIKNLRRILMGKLNGIDPKYIKERLRDSYV